LALALLIADLVTYHTDHYATLGIEHAMFMWN